MSKAENVAAIRRAINTLALVRGCDLKRANWIVVRAIGFKPFYYLMDNEAQIVLRWIGRDAPPGDLAMRHLRRALAMRAGDYIPVRTPKPKKPKPKKPKGRDPRAARKAVLVAGQGHYRRTALK